MIHFNPTMLRLSLCGAFAAAGIASSAALLAPIAGAEPTPTPEPAPTSTAPTASAAPVAADDCSAAGMASTISSVTASLSTYLAAHPDANEALLDATRQPSFVAVGRFDDYFKEHPEQADELRNIQTPLTAFKDRCRLQVAPTDALAVLAEV